MKGIKKSLMVVVAFMLPMTAMANDATYYTSGSTLTPIKETNISVAKEILTITIGKDSYAKVDVYYEFFNNDAEKIVTMGFEANAPYNGYDDERNRAGGHPYIFDFTVTMNNQKLGYTNGIVPVKWDNDTHQTDFVPVDRSKWKIYGEVADTILPEQDAIYNIETKEFSEYAYVYFFKATFHPGKNIVHHTYRYHMNESVCAPYEVPYWLTPATRWANHQIDDFTLRIKNERNDDFCFCDSLFMSAPFSISDNMGQVYQFMSKDSVHYTLCNLIDNATLEWHCKNFCPTSDLLIASAERAIGSNFINDDYSYEADVVVDKDGNPDGSYLGESGNSYFIRAQDYGMVDKKGHTVERFCAENGQGWVMAKEPGTINVRQQPTTKSAVVGKIRYVEGELPDGYDCLGTARCKDSGSYDTWFKIKFKGKVGYVRYDLVDWTAIPNF